METFHLKLIAYDEIFYDDEAASIVLPALDGEMQILPHHEDYVIALKEGEIRITAPDGKVIPAVCGSGFVEIKQNSAEVLVDTIERPEEIDVRRAREAKERIEERMRQQQSQLEYHRNSASLARAMARLKEASKYKH